MSKKEITVRIVPLSGSPVDKKVAFKTGMTVAQALESAGVSPERKDISVQAEPGQELKPGDTVVATDRKVTAGSQVTARERPQGS
ncbi:hypothetical protein COV05_00075 [Candidatus Uhrbacteria bacterium CG10_big_fil_rev_8_21_14_0_10_48_16]|uniref:Uncharacterized protein n=1 Tax=Candidatus Uhrbacteria bacterium CG10_big_fil_rev_8_21_14_0_10_48_16 TaxID=1975038 RepID=A0A2M8LIN5_9BACT|nr:MAG: hypothetical protein COV05_00075 [Candidatus Uhrbacteria bacterium CG10_big_fil_rev_8_21_14_0_10_48_16]